VWPWLTHRQTHSCWLVILLFQPQPAGWTKRYWQFLHELATIYTPADIWLSYMVYSYRYVRQVLFARWRQDAAASVTINTVMLDWILGCSLKHRFTTVWRTCVTASVLKYVTNSNTLTTTQWMTVTKLITCTDSWYTLTDWVHVLWESY